MVCCCNTIGNVFRLVIVGGCALALTMQWLNLYSCDFFDLVDSGEEIGIWYRTTDGVCDIDNTYPATDDSLIKFARSAAILSMCFGFGAGLLVFIEWICCEICCAGCVEGLAFGGACACGLGIYAFYGIDECGELADDLAGGDDTIANIGAGIMPEGIPTGSNCSWARGATYNVIACVAYLGCWILLCFAPQPKPLCKD